MVEAGKARKKWIKQHKTATLVGTASESIPNTALSIGDWSMTG